MQRLRNWALLGYDGNASVAKRLEAVLLGHLDKEILFCEDYLASLRVKLDRTVCTELVHSRVSVNSGKIVSDSAEELTVFRTYGTKLGLEGVGSEGAYVIGKLNVLNVKLLSDYLILTRSQGGTTIT